MSSSHYHLKRRFMAFGAMFFGLLTFVDIALDNNNSGHVISPFIIQRQLQKRLFEERNRTYNLYQNTEVNRTGPGERGNAVNLTEEQKLIVEKELGKEGMSPYLNSLVSLDRGLRDVRAPQCKDVVYPEDLPTMSVVIIFCNELLRVILRTVASIINRTPPRYLQEIILVDDASKKEELKGQLDDFTQNHWQGLVQVIRLKTRQGLIRARLAGIHAAMGDVIVVMDGHMEVSKGWAEPLLARMKENNRTLVAPQVDFLNVENLEFSTQIYTGQSFKWDMQFSYFTPKGGQDIDPTMPIECTGLVGCIFGMNRQVFLEMGAFDAGMDYWGAENTELPIRIWMCGGRVEIIPCSRVAHTFRVKARPWHAEKVVDYYGRNSQRLAEVWMDEYKSQYYLYRQDRVGKTDYGNITDRLELRKRLKCKSFKWFLENVVYPPKSLWNINVTAWGSLKNGVGSMCLDALASSDSGPLGAYPCYNPRTQNQLFTLTWTKQLRRDVKCADYRYSLPGQNVTMNDECENPALTQVWMYDPITSSLIHEPSQLCADAAGYKKREVTYVILTRCSEVETQRWVWEHYTGPPK